MDDSKLLIHIAGDIVPTKSNEDLFINANISSLIGSSLWRTLQKADILSVNLECPLTTCDYPLPKSGPSLRAHPDTIQGIKAIHPSVVGLANNHIMDYGEIGLSDTISILSENGISYVGVGNSLGTAFQSIHIIEKKGWRIGFYACAEHEFSIATEQEPGANPFNALVTGDLINALKAENSLDKLIVLYHGGNEYYQYPSPGLQQICRHLVEKGANLVVCQHSHCIGAYEHYQDGNIVYGQGNFIFNMKHSLAKYGLLLSYHLSRDGDKIEFIPIKTEYNGCIQLCPPKETREVLDSFMNRSEEIVDLKEVEKKFQNFSNRMFNTYLYTLSPYGKWISRFDRYLLKGMLIRLIYSKRKKLSILNVLRCETHSEIIRKGLEFEYLQRSKMNQE